MRHKSWHLDRRTFLVGSGLSLGLPVLDGMAATAPPTQPSRMFCVYFPFGVAQLAETDDNAAWGWWPIGGERDFRLSNTLKPLEAYRDSATFFQGFQHDRVKVPGHNSANFFLTGADTRAGGNTVSIDQVAAAHLGTTRIPSLTLSTDGGVGSLAMSHTLSYSEAGRPIPSMDNPVEIFERTFGEVTPTIRRQIALDESVLDLVLESSRDLKRRLGTADQRTLDEYLSSVRTLEADVRRAQSWLDAARIPVDDGQFGLEAHADDPRAYLRVMYDLVYHAFRTDTTRVATYQTGSMYAGGTTGRWPQLFGLSGSNAHALAHAAQKQPEAKSRYDAVLLEQFAYLIQRLRDTSEAGATLLDRTVLLYGSSNSRTHVNSNYPLILVGGRGLGFRHGRYHKNPKGRPMADILYTMLQGLGVPSKAFADSTGPIEELCG